MVAAFAGQHAEIGASNHFADAFFGNPPRAGAGEFLHGLIESAHPIIVVQQQEHHRRMVIDRREFGLSLPKLFFGGPPLGVIGLGAGHAQGAAIGVPGHDFASAKNPAPIAGLSSHAMLGFEGRPAAGDMTLHFLPDGIPIVGMNQPFPRTDILLNLTGGVAEHFGPSRGELKLSGGNVPFPKAVVTAFHE